MGGYKWAGGLVAMIWLLFVGGAAIHRGRREAGQSVAVGPYQAVPKGAASRAEFDERVATFMLRSGPATIARVETARRQFGARGMTTSRAGIVSLGIGQVYVAMSDLDATGAVPPRLPWKPLVALIWLGSCAMGLGGASSLADRRLRVGAPVRAMASAMRIFRALVASVALLAAEEERRIAVIEGWTS